MSKPDQAVSTAEQIGRIADKLRDVANTGRHFSKNPYDRENYEIIREAALELVAIATGASLTDLEPMRDDFFTRIGAVPTVEAAVIDQDKRLLLIQRKDNGKWAMPGGKIEIGETPAEAAERETWEESGVSVKAVEMVGVFDSYKHGSSVGTQLTQFVFLCNPLSRLGDAEAHWSQALEVSDVGWFSAEDLPTDLDANHITRIPHVFEFLKTKRAFFDPTPEKA